jgi:two-component sensor histidine kinase
MNDPTTRLASVPRRPEDLVRWAAIVAAAALAAPAITRGSAGTIAALAISVGYGVYATLRADEVHLLEDIAFLLAIVAAAIAGSQLPAFLALVIVSLAIVAYRDFLAGDAASIDSARRSPARGVPERGLGTLGDELPRLVAANERRRAVRAADRAVEWLTFAIVGLDRLDGTDPGVGDLRDDMEAAVDELRTRVELVVEANSETELHFDERLHAVAQGAGDLYGWEATTDIAPEREVSAPAAPLIRQALLDIVAEALDNAGRHSAAETVSVVWSGDGDARRLAVTDDGFGFDVAEQAGDGIDAMARTARAIGAAFDVSSVPDVGTTIVVLIPGSRVRGAATTAGGDPRGV